MRTSSADETGSSLRPEPPDPTVERPVGILSPTYRATTFGIVSLVFLVAFEAMAVGTAMPVAVKALDGLSLYAWGFSGFMAATMLGTVVSGEVSDRIGPLWPLLASVGAFAAGLATAGGAPTMLVFIAGRVLQGVGAGGAVVALMVTLAKVFPTELRPKAFGALSTAWVVPAIIGPSVAGTVAEHLSWRLVFLGLLPLVVPPLLLVVPRVRTLRGHATGTSTHGTEPTSGTGSAGQRRSRIPMAVAAATGIGMLQYAGEQMHWWSLALVAAGLALLAPSLPKLVPPGTLRFARGLPSVVRMRGILGGVFGATGAYVPLMLIEQHDQSASLAGIALTVGSLGWSSGAFLQARRKLQIPRSRLVQLGAGSVTLGVSGMIGVVIPAVPWWFGPLAWTIAGLGMGLAMASLSVLLLEYSPVQEQGANSAAMQLAESVGNVCLVGLSGVVFASLHGTVADVWVFGAIFALMALVVAAGFGTAGRVRSVEAAAAATAGA